MSFIDDGETQVHTLRGRERDIHGGFAGIVLYFIFVYFKTWTTKRTHLHDT